MINLKKIIGQGFEARDKGLELIGSTIQRAAESVGLGIDDSGLVRKLPVDIANDPALSKEFLTVFEKNYPTIRGAKIVINGSKDWMREYQFNRLIERNRIAAAIFEEGGAHYSQWFTFTQNWADDGWGNTLIKIAHSKSKIDPAIL